MRKSLLLIPLLIALLACNFTVTTLPAATATATIPPKNEPSSAAPQATFTVTVEASNTAVSSGTITGQLSYPSEFLPSMRVAFFSLTDGKAYYVDTAKGQGEYSMDLPAGMYYVVSYLHEGIPGNTGQVDSYTLGGGPYAGGYTQMVPCGLSYGCDDHTLLAATVKEGQTVNVDPGDWYAPDGTFPPMPNP